MYRKKQFGYIEYVAVWHSSFTDDIDYFIRSIYSSIMPRHNFYAEPLWQDCDLKSLLRHVYEKEFKAGINIVARFLPRFDKVNRCPSHINNRYENKSGAYIVYATLVFNKVFDSQCPTLYLNILETERGKMLRKLG